LCACARDTCLGLCKRHLLVPVYCVKPKRHIYGKRHVCVPVQEAFQEPLFAWASFSVGTGVLWTTYQVPIFM